MIALYSLLYRLVEDGADTEEIDGLAVERTLEDEFEEVDEL